MKMKTKRRSLLYFPASRGEWYGKLCKYDADVFIFDLEDAVKECKISKDFARKTLVETRKSKCLFKKEIFIRVNSIKSPYFQEDARAIFRLDIIPDAIVLPKVESVEEIRELERILSRYEKKKNLKPFEIVPTIETLKGEENAKSILKSSKRITTVQFGENGDYEASYGSLIPFDARKDPLSNDFLVRILKLTRLYNLLFIDGVYFKKAENKKDKKELEERCKYIKMLGGAGKAVIHPSQISIVNKIFSLDQKIIEENERKIKEYESYLKTKNNHSAYYRKGTHLIGPTEYRNAKKLNILYKK